MVAVKKEGGGGKSKGGGGSGKGGGGSSNNNTPANQQQKGPLHPALYTTNEKMMEVLRCGSVDLALLKHGAAKIVKKHPQIPAPPHRWELSEKEPEWAEMLSGERWEGEDYPDRAGFEKNIEFVMIKIKSLCTRKLNAEGKKKAKRGTRPSNDDKGIGSEGGHGEEAGRLRGDERLVERRSGGKRGGGGEDRDGGGSEDDYGVSSDDGDSRGGGGRSGGNFMMSGGLSHDSPIPRTPISKTFQKLNWTDKNVTSSNSVTGNLSREDEDDGRPGASPTKSTQKRRSPFLRRFGTEPTPTPASRNPRPNQMFVSEDDDDDDDDDDSFVGVTDAARNPRGRPNANRNGAGNKIRGGTKMNVVDLCDSD